jgi:hypothetical protein
MWKSLLVVVISAPLSLAVGVAFWAAQGWRTGIVACCGTFAACLVAATLLAFFTRRLTLVDVFLPLIFSVIWSLILMPFSLGSDLFTAPAAIGSGMLLTWCLWRVHHEGGQEGESRKWLILPILVYVYEMMPINIPGVFDDYFAITGDLALVLLYQLATRHKRLPGPGTPNPNLPSPHLNDANLK